MMCTLTEAARSAGNDGQWGGWIPFWAWDRFWNHIHMFGGKIVDEKYGKKCMLGEPEAQEALAVDGRHRVDQELHRAACQVENQWFRNAMNPRMIVQRRVGHLPDQRGQGL